MMAAALKGRSFAVRSRIGHIAVSFRAWRGIPSACGTGCFAVGACPERSQWAALHDTAQPLHALLVVRRAGLRALDAELDQLFDQPRVLHLRRFPQLRKERARREARNGVDLVDEEAVRAALEEKVDARVAGRTHGLERRNGETPQLLALLLRQLGRDDELRLVVDVLVGVVVEVAAG